MRFKNFKYRHPIFKNKSVEEFILELEGNGWKILNKTPQINFWGKMTYILTCCKNNKQ